MPDARHPAVALPRQQSTHADGINLRHLHAFAASGKP
jgi:hypothetical protein